MAFKVHKQVRVTLKWTDPDTGQDVDLIHVFSAPALRKANAERTKALINSGIGMPSEQLLFKRFQRMQTLVSADLPVPEVDHLSEAEESKLAKLLPRTTAIQDDSAAGYDAAIVSIEGYEGDDGTEATPADVPDSHKAAALTAAIASLSGREKLTIDSGESVSASSGSPVLAVLENAPSKTGEVAPE